MIVGIIGGGASGMAAAIAAASYSQIQVLLFERQARLGRKLLATGNGRCNLTNMHASADHYHGDFPEFVTAAMEKMDVSKTLAWFKELGLFTVADENGRVYPYSDQSNSVVDILRFALNKPNITVYTGFDVKKIQHVDNGFAVDNGEQTYRCDRLIIACGGLAGTKLGGSISGYKLLGKFGHKSTRLRPALVQLKTSWNAVTALKGVRAQCHAAIYHDGCLYSESSGELQFTDYGISGPVVFEISRDACQRKGLWNCRLDFLPHISAESLISELKLRCHRAVAAEELLTGILHNRLGRVLVKEAGIRSNFDTALLDDTAIARLCACIKSFEIGLTEPLGMDSAQVTAGGVVTNDFDPDTMHSKLVPGLYACGEVLDIDGDCGGYNLQWAWSSGYCAGINAGKETK